MTDGAAMLFGAVGAVAAVLAVLVPLIRAQGAVLRREIEGQGASLRREIDTRSAAGHLQRCQADRRRGGCWRLGWGSTGGTAPSSSSIVPVAVAAPADRVALTASLNVTVNDSGPSTTASLTIATSMVPAVTPASKVSVPPVVS